MMTSQYFIFVIFYVFGQFAFRMHFELYYDNIENVLKNHYFGTLTKSDDVIKFSLAPKLQKVCDLIYKRLSYMHTMFHGPSPSGSNFR